MFILSTFFILFLLSFNLFLISRFKDLEGFIIFSFLIKICILIINNNLFFVMDGSADALNFHNHMVEYSRKPISIIFDKGFHGIYFLSQIGGLIYKFFGESIYLMQFLSITISIASLILFNRTIKLLTKSKEGIFFSTLFFCIYPILLNYSILTMREVYTVFLILLSTFLFLKFLKSYDYKFFFLSFLPSIFLVYINGGSVVIFLVFFIFGLKIMFKRNKYNQKNSFIKTSVFLLLFSSIFALFFVGFENIPYLNTAEIMFRDGDFSKIIQIYEVIQFKVSSAANYPLYLIPEDNLIDFVYKSFLRLLYFLYGPFAWELERYRHIIAFGDGLLHLFITIYLIKNYKFIIRDEKLIFILLCYVMLVATYSLGTGNFSQALRHKSKFIPLLLLILGTTKFFNILLIFKNYSHKYKKYI